MDLQSALQWVVKESRDSLEPLTSKDLEGAAIPKMPQDSCEARDFRLGCTCSGEPSLCLGFPGRSRSKGSELLA